MYSNNVRRFHNHTMNFVMFEYEKKILIMSCIYMLYLMYQVYTHVTIKKLETIESQ